MGGGVRDLSGSLCRRAVALFPVLFLVSIVTACASTPPLNAEARAALDENASTDRHGNRCFEFKFGKNENGQLVCPAVSAVE
jgi:peptidoglycan/LPS O-acetylase OafA/YrhL